MNPLHVEQGKRLKQAREKFYPRSARSAALENEWPESTYRSHEAGTRGMAPEDFRRYGRRFKVDPLWIEHGDAVLSGRRIAQVVGYAGGGEVVYSIDDFPQGYGLDEVLAPADFGKDGVGIIVRGDSMRPTFRDGDVILYDRQVPATHLDGILGEECVVRLVDGSTFVKELHRGSRKDRWTLISHNAAPIEDVRVEWAAPIAFVAKGAARKKRLSGRQ